MAKRRISEALRQYRQQLENMDEMSRANMTEAESDQYPGFQPGMDKQKLSDATEMAMATKNEDEARQLLSAGQSLSRKADEVKEDREWKEWLNAKREKEIARQKRIDDSVVRTNVIARRGEGLLPLPKEIMGSGEGLAMGLDPNKLEDDDLIYLGMTGDEVKKFRGR